VAEIGRFLGSRQQGVERFAECGELAVDAHVGPGGGEEVDYRASAGRVFDDVGEVGEPRRWLWSRRSEWCR
jgi:hypothetical protein